MVPGDEMTEVFANANVSTSMAISGVLDGVKYLVGAEGAIVRDEDDGDRGSVDCK